MPLPFVVILVYFVLIGAFSAAYYIAWQYNSDCFIIHQEMNLTPLAAWRRTRRLGSKREVKRTQTAIPLEEVNARYTALADQENQIQSDVAEAEQQMAVAREELAYLAKLHNEEVAANMKTLIERRQSEYKSELNEIEAALKQKISDVTTTPKEAGEAASAAQKSATDSFVADTSGPSLLSGATNTNYLAAATQANEKYGPVLKKSIDLADALLKVRNDQLALFEPWEKERLERLKYFDFLYFSMGVATSNTFGDMIPNQRIIRTLISIQLFTSIVLIGLFLNSLAK
jgi:Ion channel